MTDPGQRPHLVTIQRAIVAEDDYGGETRTWHDHLTAWARVRYGLGEERRVAEQENASQTAIFDFDWSADLASVTMKDRLRVFSTSWDIIGNVTVGNNRDILISAVANLDAEIDS